MRKSVNKFEIGNYTYDAAGERVVRYVPKRLDTFYSAHNAAEDDRLESFVYPSGLLTVKTLPLKPGTDLAPRMKLTTYTKHYYLGSERIASSLGRANDLGLFCKELQTYGMDNYLNEMDSKTAQAGEELNADYQYFEKALNLSSPILYNNAVPGCSLYPDSEKEYAVFWFHPDHLGSSSYISNKNGEISQHLEYFPFGETLVEEHKNSNNSPYKFNAKELDAETGNYYYGARYYNPKFSIWLSVDPLTEKYPGWSPYNYTLLNPVRFIDPDGRSVEWKPKLNDDGSTTYTKEANDTQATLKSQYELSDEIASKLYSSMDKSGAISGQSVYNTRGSEVLKLDLNSKQATDQRKFDQYVYGRDRTASLRSSYKGIYAFLATDYYLNTEFKNVMRGYANMSINGENIKLHFNIPVYNSVSSSSDIGIGVSPVRIKPIGLGGHFGNNQNAVRSPIYHPKTGNQMGDFDIYAKGDNADKIFHRLRKTFPTYHYINTNFYKE